MVLSYAFNKKKIVHLFLKYFEFCTLVIINQLVSPDKRHHIVFDCLSLYSQAPLLFFFSCVQKEPEPKQPTSSTKTSSEPKETEKGKQQLTQRKESSPSSPSSSRTFLIPFVVIIVAVVVYWLLER